MIKYDLNDNTADILLLMAYIDPIKVLPTYACSRCCVKEPSIDSYNTSLVCNSFLHGGRHMILAPSLPARFQDRNSLSWAIDSEAMT